MRRIKGQFNAVFSAVAPKDLISWGDYQWWDVEVIRDAIRKQYGANTASELTLQDNCLGFECSDEVDFDSIGKDLGVAVCEPSLSSRSSTATKRGYRR